MAARKRFAQSKRATRERKAKRPTQGDGPQRGKASRNWSTITERWFAYSGTLAAFCRRYKIPESTGRKYLSVSEKNKLVEDIHQAPGFREALRDAAAKENGRTYVAAMKMVHKAHEEILLDSVERFKEKRLPMSEREAAKTALLAGDALVRVSAELQGIPKDEDGFGWPLTKGFDPFSYQRDFIFDTPASTLLEHGEAVFVYGFVGGVGSGKTYCGAQKAGQIAWLNRGCLGIVAAPTYRMLEDSTKPMFFKALGEKAISYKYLKTDNAIILFGDTKIIFRSMDKPEHIKGPNAAWVWIDEGAVMKTREAFDVLQARIRDPKAPGKCLVMTTTPDGLGWLYDILVTDATANRAKIYRARTDQNPTLGDYHTRLKKTYDSKLASQELDAEFLNIFAGQAYWNFSPTASIFSTRDLKLHKGLPLDLCCDFNVSPMCWNVSQDYRQEGEDFTYVLDEMHLDTAGTEVAADEFIDRYLGFKPTVRVWGDATGAHRHTSATRSDYEIIEQRLKKAGFDVDINIGRSNPRVSDRVAAVNARLEDSNGTRKLFIAKSCKRTLVDFERTAFKPGTRELDKGDETRTHHSDAIGYRIHKQWPVRGPEITQRRAA